MKDQRAILNKCVINDYPAFVVAGTDICAVELVQAYVEIAKKKGCSEEFLKDMELVVEEMKVFHEQERELIRLPD